MRIKLTANFERNLADIEHFLAEAEAPQAFDTLIDELLDTVLPNLERFPELGGPFFNRAVGSAEAANANAELQAKLAALAGSSLNSLREYVMKSHVVLYVQVEDTLYLLSIKHQKQLSFDFEGHWVN
ncbi:type II toxin-antitoxin system RelE/ParE family toxin [Limnobacter sp.]|uniref:type II toxin-antitoxin system RelE/ParE family toxin n=1 Tax=Limnobacter sp. TaxID=2003368 RepID=UPI00258FAB53|nr:type II toxin-antitoxin system RelE/ParE family toxin [Limnobacter sp.]